MLGGLVFFVHWLLETRANHHLEVAQPCAQDSSCRLPLLNTPPRSNFRWTTFHPIVWYAVFMTDTAIRATDACERLVNRRYLC
jgi:hypothetical protein